MVRRLRLSSPDREGWLSASSGTSAHPNLRAFEHEPIALDPIDGELVDHLPLMIVREDLATAVSRSV
jgi:hypothetical protein